MQITQIYEHVNQALQESIGDTVVLNEDLSNIVTAGDAVFNANAMDKYVKALVNRIGKTIFVNRVYGGDAPNILMDGWEYGSVLQKVSIGLQKSTMNETWELEDGQSYDPHIFHKPKEIVVKYYNSYVTFEVDMSFGEEQLKMSFTSGQAMNSFLSMIYTSVENTMTVNIDNLKRRAINNMIGETIYADYKGSDTKAKSGVRAINLLKLYNTQKGTTITADKAILDLDFIKFASYQMKLVHDQMRSMSTIYNIGGVPKFTSTEYSRIALLNQFARSADTYLQSDTFHNEFTKLPQADIVNYWQGSGESFAFKDVSSIDIKTSEGNTVKQSGILGIIYDKYACMVSNVDRKVTSQWTPNAEFFTNFYKYKAGLFNDFNENFVVFFVA